MALRRSLGVMAIPLAKSLITVGVALQCGCQLQEAGVPLTDALSLQSSVVPIVGIGVIETLSHSCCFGVGVDIPQGVEHPFVVFRCNGSRVIPGFSEMPATPSKAVECHC